MTPATTATLAAAAFTGWLSMAAPARAAPPPSSAATDAGSAWQHCATLTGDNEARLACFDHWAARQQPTPVEAPAPATLPMVAAAEATPPSPPKANGGCRDGSYSQLSRFWELEDGTDCGTFGIRGYRPISISVTTASSVNTQPSSPAEGHTALSAQSYDRTETRIQVSVRTKIAKSLLTGGSDSRQDSLWFGYTAQSYWQIFNTELSRPFRNTDHEPELIYVYPSQLQLPLGWQLRYSGLGLVHQSNGQSLPLSRSWNRAYLMAGVEKGNTWNVNARIWRRFAENPDQDDNPGISNYIGRGELQLGWNPDSVNTLNLTLRDSFGHTTRGSARLEWLRALGKATDERSGLRLHLQLFTGYGDSLIDYNKSRTVFSVGLSLLDF
ncbi:MAG TPA: phospholipase A [Burkholderiaceae bacterium]